MFNLPSADCYDALKNSKQHQHIFQLLSKTLDDFNIKSEQERKICGESILRMMVVGQQIPNIRDQKALLLIQLLESFKTKLKALGLFE